MFECERRTSYFYSPGGGCFPAILLALLSFSLVVVYAPANAQDAVETPASLRSRTVSGTGRTVGSSPEITYPHVVEVDLRDPKSQRKREKSQRNEAGRKESGKAAESKSQSTDTTGKKADRVLFLPPACTPDATEQSPASPRARIECEQGAPLTGNFYVACDGHLINGLIVSDPQIDLHEGELSKEEQDGWNDWLIKFGQGLFNRFFENRGKSDELTLFFTVGPEERSIAVTAANPDSGAAFEPSSERKLNSSLAKSVDELPWLPKPEKAPKFRKISFLVTAASDPESFPRSSAKQLGCRAELKAGRLHVVSALPIRLGAVSNLTSVRMGGGSID